VFGANVPALLASIAELTPANADVDDLEANPFFVAGRGEIKAKSNRGDTGISRH
jgi:hypothetical protein